MAIYIIDTCSLTTLRRIYPPTVFPSVWRKVEELIDSGNIISSEVVLWELETHDDLLIDWVNSKPHLFIPLNDEVQILATEILNTHSNLIDHKKYNSSADPFLIALARINNGIIVTEENESGGPHRSKIPDVCGDYNVESIKLLELLEREGLQI